MDLNQSQSEILLAAELKARRVLSDARQRTEHALADATRDAIALLSEHQREAERLLLEQEEEASERAPGSPLGDDLEERRNQAAAELALSQHRAAEVLLQAQRLAAEKLASAVMKANNEDIMVAHKEAAAILLEARLRIEDERTAQENRSRQVERTG